MSLSISVVVPVSERHDDIAELHRAYREAVSGRAPEHEFVYVLDGEFPDVRDTLVGLQAAGEPLTVIQLAKWFGEATALSAGFDHARHDVILTLPAYYQIEPGEIPRLIDALEDQDMVIARRGPRIDAAINRLQSRVFHAILNFVADTRYEDLGCGVRLLRRVVADEVPVYGDQHRFFPLLAHRRGFRVRELDVRQAQQDTGRRVYAPGVYLRRLLDILTVFFLVKFTKKPLRFFGLLGSATTMIGGVLVTYVVVQRLFFGVALADRPALLLSSLLVVLGVQLFALGLIGELIIFTHARSIKEYTIDRIIN